MSVLRRSSKRLRFSCCVMIRFGSLMVQGPSLKLPHQRQENREMGAGLNENKKRRELMSRLTRWKRALRQERARDLPIRPNVRFLRWRFPSTSRLGRRAALTSWSVLTVGLHGRLSRIAASSASSSMTE